jgi:DNA-binding NtrC family response regulator
VQESLVSTFHTTLLNPSDSVLSLLDEVPLEAVILDLDRADEPNQEAVRLLEDLRRADPDLVLFALTRSRSKALRRNAAKAGVDEFFVAPMDFNQIQIVLQHALEKRYLEIESRQLREQALSGYSFCDLIGSSELMRLVYDAITRVADGNATVLIRGESGTGKELVAQAIVASGGRRDQPFISVNCSALPETLIEAELFGHEKGSFTGAYESRAGHIEAAQGGTLFLDEIGTLGLGLQSKLLRVLEQRTVQRIGSKTVKKIDFRLITATNEDLEEAVSAGRFREDLYYRINVVPISLPPLREREGDVPLLVDHFLRFYSRANSLPLKRVEPDVLENRGAEGYPGHAKSGSELHACGRTCSPTSSQARRPTGSASCCAPGSSARCTPSSSARCTPSRPASSASGSSPGSPTSSASRCAPSSSSGSSPGLRNAGLSIVAQEKGLQKSAALLLLLDKWRVPPYHMRRLIKSRANRQVNSPTLRRPTRIFAFPVMPSLKP